MDDYTAENAISSPGSHDDRGLYHHSRTRSAETTVSAAVGAPIPLPDIPQQCEAHLISNGAPGLLGQRLVDLGFTTGAAVRLVRKGPKGNLITVSIRSTVVALRSDEARSLLVAV